MSVLVRLGLVILVFVFVALLCDSINPILSKESNIILGRMLIVGAVLFIFPKWKE